MGDSNRNGSDRGVKCACEGVDPEVFYPPPGGGPELERALAYCRRCQVRERCLELFLGEPQGVFGGMSAIARKRERRRRRLEAA